MISITYAIIMAVLGIIIGSVIIYLLLARKLKDVEILNEKTREQNQHIQEENQKLTKEYYDLTYANNDLKKDLTMKVIYTSLIKSFN